MQLFEYSLELSIHSNITDSKNLNFVWLYSIQNVYNNTRKKKLNTTK